MKNLKKTVSVLMAAVMLITVFAGCGKTEDESSKMPEFIYVPTYYDIEIPEEVQYLGGIKFLGERFYGIAEIMVEGETVTDEVTGESYTESKYVQQLVSFDEKGGGFKSEVTVGEDNYYGENGNSYSEYIVDYFETKNGPAVLVCENTTTVDLPENFNYETGNYWEYETAESIYSVHILGGEVNLDEGTVISTAGNKKENSFYPNYVLAASDGNIYLASWDIIKIFDSDFNEVATVEAGEGGCNGMAELRDKSVAFLTWEENGNAIKIIDLATKKTGESISVSDNIYTLASGGGVYDFVYPTPSGSGIMGFNLDEEPINILDWIDSDVDPSGINSERIFIKDEENIIAFSEEWNEEGNAYKVIHLKKTPSAELPEKKVITLACMYLDYDVRQKIVEYNRTNPEYRIRAVDYSQFATEEDYAGLTKLNTEIISGNIPDIFVTNGMPMTRYAGKGIFEDLVPYIERDNGWDKLVEAPFRALMNDEGKLYEIYPSFSVNTYVGLKNVVGDGESWTFNDLKEAYAKLPEGATVFEDSATKDYAFHLLVNNQMDSFIDWEKGECYFESDEFIDILELVATFPTEFDYTDEYYSHYVQPIVKVAKGEQLICATNIYNANTFRSRVLYILGDQTSFVGLPTNEGTGNSFTFYSGYAMSASSEHKEAAWEFISEILTEEHQDREYYGDIPTNKAAFDRMIEKEMTPEFDEFYDPEQAANPYAEYNPQIGGDIAVETPAMPGGEGKENKLDFTLPDYAKGQVNEKGWHEVPKTYGWIDNGYNGIEFPVYAMTEAERDIFMNLIETTTKVSRYDNSVNDIINEEIAYFFNGDRTAQQTAEYIQSRVNLYVNEQR